MTDGKRMTDVLFEKVERFNLLAQALGITPVPPIILTAKSIAPDGSEVASVKQVAQSYTRQFYNIWFTRLTAAAASAATFGAGYLGCKVTGLGSLGAGTLVAIRGFNNDLTGGSNISNQDFRWGANIVGSGDRSVGIVIGTGTSGANFEGTVLTTPVTHGTGSGQMVFNAQSGPTPTYDTPTKTWTCVVARTFNNNSGGTIAVGETGIYVKYLYNASVVADSFMIEWSNLGSPVSVLHGGQLIVSYTFTLTFPA